MNALPGGNFAGGLMTTTESFNDQEKVIVKLLLFFMLQKRFVEGLTAGGVKG